MGKADQAEALEQLRAILKPGDTVHTILRHVSQSGMSRAISVVAVGKDGSTRQLDWLIAKAGLFKEHRTYIGLSVGGAGMDMGFHVVYSLSSALYRDTFKCTGHDGTGRAPRCPSNDHVNYRPWIEQGTYNHDTHEWEGRIENPEPNYKRGMKHSDGGYALKQQWL